MNMDFLNRNSEMKWLDEMYGYSKRKLFPIVIHGSRRVGKTTLVKNFIKGKNALYIFVNETKSSHVLGTEVVGEMKAQGALEEYVFLENWDGILKHLIEKSKFDIIVFDEFQNFLSVDKTVFGTLQNLIDQNENKKGPLLVFLGSSTGLIKEVFENNSAALYGRVKAKLNMKPLLFHDFVFGMEKLGFKNYADATEFYFVFGGYPKYLTALEDFKVPPGDIFEILKFFFFRHNGVFQNEVRDILRTEFGSKGAQYYSVLEAIATGHTKLSEISSYIGIPSTSTSTFLTHLADQFEIVEKNQPILRPKVKDTRYLIKNPLFRFWFRFVRPHRAHFELGKYHEFDKLLRRDFSTFAGREFEKLCKEYLIYSLKEGKIDFSDTGSWWHKDQEIDIVTLGKDECVWECKWSSLNKKEAEEISRKLDEKVSFTGLKNPKKGLFAREVGKGVLDIFDFVITLDDVVKGRFPKR